MRTFKIYFEWQGPMSSSIHLMETFIGTWEELGAYIEKIKGNGCFNIRTEEMVTTEVTA